MGQKNILVQKLKIEDISSIDKAIRYYNFLFTLYGIKLPKKELELFAFTAIRGTITPLAARKEFIAKFNSSRASIENIKGRLVKKGLLVYVENKYKINPKFILDFNKDIVIRLELKIKENGTEGEVRETDSRKIESTEERC